MKKFLFVFALLLSFATFCLAQTIYDGLPLDSTTIRFNSGSIPGYVADTASSPLWQIGLTHKPFFATDTSGTFAIMTDTTNFYPTNANNYFIIKIPPGINRIVDFWHKFQTDSMHAGGIVEFSQDTGITWQNVKGPCNEDSNFAGFSGIVTEGVYTFADTLLDGTPAFTGTSSGLKYSRIQFFNGFPVKTTSTGGCEMTTGMIYLRFRFVSDTTVDTLAGWIIDSIKVERDMYWGSVNKMNTLKSLYVSPNPSYDGSFTFPELEEEKGFSIEVYNALGTRLLHAPYRHSIQIANYPSGLYFYRVTNGADVYQGQLLKE